MDPRAKTNLQTEEQKVRKERLDDSLGGYTWRGQKRHRERKTGYKRQSERRT